MPAERRRGTNQKKKSRRQNENETERKAKELETHHPVELNPTKAVNPASTIIDHLKNVKSNALPCF